MLKAFRLLSFLLLVSSPLLCQTASLRVEDANNRRLELTTRLTF